MGFHVVFCSSFDSKTASLTPRDPRLLAREALGLLIAKITYLAGGFNPVVDLFHPETWRKNMDSQFANCHICFNFIHVIFLINYSRRKLTYC